MPEQAHHTLCARNPPQWARRAPEQPASSETLMGPQRNFRKTDRKIYVQYQVLLACFTPFFHNTVYGVYLFTFLLRSEESLRVLEVFRERLTHLYQIMQVSGYSRLNINRINNVFQQRLGLP